MQRFFSISSPFGKSILLSVLVFLQFVSEAQNPSITDTSAIIPDTLLFRLEKYQSLVNEINTTNKKSIDLNKIKNELRQHQINVTQVDTAMQVEKTVPDYKNLVNYRLMLTDAQQKTDQLRKSLSTYNNELQQRSEEIIQFGRDSLFIVDESDSSQKRLYNSQITNLKLRLQDTGKLTVARLDTVSQLLADASDVYFRSTDLLNLVNEYIKESGQNVLGKEYNYLWKAPKQDSTNNIGKLIKLSYSGQDKILRYFFNSTWDNRILLLLICIGFFFWVRINFQLLRKPNLAKLVGDLNFRYIKPFPLLATLLVLLTISPIFEPDSPSIYVELNQFLLIVLLSIVFSKRLPKSLLRLWYMTVGLYVMVIISNAVVNESLLLRLWLIALNLISIYFGRWIYRKVQEINFDKRFIKPVIVVHVILNILAILLNIFGRVSLAKYHNLTAIGGLVQLAALIVFIQLLSEAMELQIKVSSCGGGLFSRINVSKSRNSYQKNLTFLAIFIWLVVFAINLNIIDPLINFANMVLNKPRTFGNVTFTLENVLYFSVIIWISNQLQKNINLIFGESDTSFGTQEARKNSKLVLVRLIIFVIGFLLAVSAAGVPIGRVTVLLGALGVGIGLGLQNIINNFVSGIILIFDKPFVVGDFIELGDKKGKVLDIGIRSSKMVTTQGYRVIIPNGDLLSGRLVNYTEKNSHLKSEILFKIGIESDVELAKKLIKETVEKADELVKKAPIQILFNTISADSIELKVTVWITSVYVESSLKSFVLERMLEKFKEHSIKLM
jgi:potassium efflux system protein